MTEREASIWLAGLLEGEGCFYVGKHDAYRARICVTLKMTDEDVVRRAASLTEYKGFIKPHRPPSHKDHWKAHFELQWYGQSAEDLMRRVLPFMGERRAAKINECLALELSHHPRRNA